MGLRFATDALPVPPAELIGRVTGFFDDFDGRIFHEYGKANLLELERGLRSTGREFSDFKRLLDFGCGPGRFLCHLGPLAKQVELHGIDIDGDAIDWARGHIDHARFSVTGSPGPTPCCC